MQVLIAGGRRKVPGELVALHAGVFGAAMGPHAGQPDGAAGALDGVVAATCLAKLYGVQASRQVVLNPRGSACARRIFISTEEGDLRVSGSMGMVVNTPMQGDPREWNTFTHRKSH